jgi:hypothetical protein
MSGYVRPVDPTDGRICTWQTHTFRVPPSNEAGVDYYCPIGTPVRAAAAGRVFETGGGTAPATGRFLTIDLDDGRRVRYLHLSTWLMRAGDGARRGDIVALSGSSGYGSEFFGATSVAKIPANTGGPHVHTTLWSRHAYTFGPHAGTLDFEVFADHGARSAGGSDSPLTIPEEEDEMLALNIIHGDRTYKCMLGDGVFRHLIASDDPEWVKDIERARDDWQDVPIAKLPVLLHGHGCDLNIWDVRNGDFAVMNPLDGTVRAGGMWSAWNAVRAAIAGISTAPADLSELAKQITSDFFAQLAAAAANP